MFDSVVVAIFTGFALATWLLVLLADRLQGGQS